MKTNKELKTKVIKAFCVVALFWVCLHAGQVNGQIPGNRESIAKLLAHEDADYLNDVIDILFNADTITYSDVIEADANNCQDSILDMYWKRSDVKVLSKKDKRDLFYIFLHNPVCYERGMVGISSPYVPILQFTMSRNRKELVILFSLSNKTWSMLYNGKKIFRNRFPSNDETNRFIEHLLN